MFDLYKEDTDNLRKLALAAALGVMMFIVAGSATITLPLIIAALGKLRFTAGMVSLIPLLVLVVISINLKL